MKKVNCGDAAA